MNQNTPTRQVQDAVAAALPPFLSVLSIDSEPISTGADAVKINFKATLATKEDLYQLDREVEGTPKVILIKVVQHAGDKATLYGSVAANRIMDKWTLEAPRIQVGLNQFGVPRGSFDAQSYITGSAEAAAALKQQASNAELQAQERKAEKERQARERLEQEERQAREDKIQREKQEQTRIALEEQRKKAAEENKIAVEKRKMDEKRQAALEHVESLEERSLEKARNVQRCLSMFGAKSGSTKHAREEAANAKSVAVEARKEYEIEYPEVAPDQEQAAPPTASPNAAPASNSESVPNGARDAAPQKPFSFRSIHH